MTTKTTNEITICNNAKLNDAVNSAVDNGDLNGDLVVTLLKLVKIRAAYMSNANVITDDCMLDNAFVNIVGCLERNNLEAAKDTARSSAVFYATRLAETVARLDDGVACSSLTKTDAHAAVAMHNVADAVGSMARTAFNSGN